MQPVGLGSGTASHSARGRRNHELDPARRIELYHKIQQQFMERAPFAMLLQRNAVAVLGKGVSGFRVGPMPDYTHYSTIAKA